MKSVKVVLDELIAMAQSDTVSRDINVFNTKDNQWYKWNGSEFVLSETPMLQRILRDIEARQDKGRMTEESVQAVRCLYTKLTLNYLIYNRSYSSATT